MADTPPLSTLLEDLPNPLAKISEWDGNSEWGIEVFCKTFSSFYQQPVGTSKLALRLALCFLFWDRRLFFEGRAQSTTFLYASCTFPAASHRQEMPPLYTDG